LVSLLLEVVDSTEDRTSEVEIVEESSVRVVDILVAVSTHHRPAFVDLIS
jgi:hypothetical protein